MTCHAAHMRVPGILFSAHCLCVSIADSACNARLRIRGVRRWSRSFLLEVTFAQRGCECACSLQCFSRKWELSECSSCILIVGQFFCCHLVAFCCMWVTCHVRTAQMWVRVTVVGFSCWSLIVGQFFVAVRLFLCCIGARLFSCSRAKCMLKSFQFFWCTCDYVSCARFQFHVAVRFASLLQWSKVHVEVFSVAFERSACWSHFNSLWCTRDNVYSARFQLHVHGRFLWKCASHCSDNIDFMIFWPGKASLS